MSKNLYNILGVAKTSTEAEIKSAYRKLARKYHPDTNKDNPESVEKFKEVSAAYDILSDKEKRKKYDNNEIDADGKPTGFGASGGFGGGYSSQGGSYSRNPFGGGGAEGFDFSSIFGEDIFSAFGGGRSNGFQGRSSRSNQYRAQKGQDVAYNMRVSFIDAAVGDEKTLKINGKNINVKIPAGTVDGQTLRLKGLGYVGYNGGKDGDALITINVDAHPYFKLDGKNILLNLPISMKEAILGAKVTVPTISGNVIVNIPAYASTGDKLRLKNKGITTNNISGDQIIILEIVSPKEKNPDLEDVLKNSKNDVIRDF